MANLYSGKDPRELPFYTAPEAAFYLGIPTSTLRAWAGQKSYRVSGGRRRMEPLVKLDDTGMLTFNSFVEAFVLTSLTRRFKLPLQKVRNSVRYLGGERPLLTNRGLLSTDRAGIYVDRFGTLIDTSQGGQAALRVVVESSLERVDFDDENLPERFYPWRKDINEPKVVSIDARRAFGRPTVANRAVKVDVILDRYRAGESIGYLSQEYDMPTDIIEGVMRWGLDGAAAA